MNKKKKLIIIIIMSIGVLLIVAYILFSTIFNNESDNIYNKYSVKNGDYKNELIEISNAFVKQENNQYYFTFDSNVIKDSITNVKVEVILRENDKIIYSNIVLLDNFENNNDLTMKLSIDSYKFNNGKYEVKYNIVNSGELDYYDVKSKD